MGINNDFIKFDYIFNVDDQLSKANYKSLDMELTVNKFITSFKFLNTNKALGTYGAHDHDIFSDTIFRYIQDKHSD